MTYADPTRCPSCGTVASGSPRCPRCSVQLRGERPLTLLRLLSEADTVLRELQDEAAAWRAQQADARPPVEPPRPAPAGGPPVATPGRPPAGASRRWTVGGTLLALGALCLVVAAFVFIAVTWGRVGLTGRTLILLAFTAAACGSAVWLTTRRLRASAETMWTVTGVLAAVDAGAAMSAGLLGLDELDGAAVVVGFGAVLAGVGAVVAVWSRRWMPTLVSAQLGVAIGAVSAAVALVLLMEVDLRWTLTPVAALVILLAVVCWRGALLVAAWVTALGGASMLGLAALWIVTGVALSPTFSTRWSEGDAPAALLHGVLVVALSVVVSHAFSGHVARLAVSLVRGVAGFDLAVCVAAVFLLVGEQVPPEVASTTWIAVPLVLAGAGLLHARWSRGWETGVRAALAVGVLPLLIGVVVAGVGALSAVSDSWLPGWSTDVGLRLAADSGLSPGRAFALWLGAAGVACVVAWWPQPSSTRPQRVALLATAALLAVAGAAVLVVLLDAPVVVLALGQLVVAGGAAVLWMLLREDSGASVVAAATALLWTAAAALAPIGSAPAATLTWTVGAAAAIVVAATALALRPRSAQRDAGVAAAVGVAGVLGVAAAVGWADVAGADARVLALVAASLAAVLLLGSAVPRLPAPVRLAVEVVAPMAGLVSVGFAAWVGTAWSSLVFTIVGVAMTTVGLLRADRRVYAPTGAALLGLAYVLRLVASDIGVVEAYTLPFGIVLLAVGAVLVVRDAARSSDVLWPGLTLALLPSLPQALGDPASLRGLLLALAAVGVLAAGASLRWRAPFVIGGALTTVLVVRWAGPFVGDLPRWLPPGVVGVGLVLAGATWEARVRDARAVVAYVQRLR
ncbi:hypothetical protein KV100_03600 [Mumia sp. zg.B21]|uniref:SCO7613 C-terminal domain-containing membrane protein n=1 Tax=Mumia sp. zg.B21 TaxID=2855447 RepID=UPI001C6E0A4B|nr:hypothetical protein [Mumia sp. zg.B21]MBW9208728.1 hypothetical protein [Mumia sp. zg.B21]